MSEYGDFRVPYMPVLVQANLQEESVTRKVTVRLKSRCDENDQWGYDDVGQRSNFKKFPTHRQDHGDA